MRAFGNRSFIDISYTYKLNCNDVLLVLACDLLESMYIYFYPRSGFDSRFVPDPIRKSGYPEGPNPDLDSKMLDPSKPDPDPDILIFKSGYPDP